MYLDYNIDQIHLLYNNYKSALLLIFVAEVSRFFVSNLFKKLSKIFVIKVKKNITEQISSMIWKIGMDVASGSGGADKLKETLHIHMHMC
jgi:hypothetical protein